MTIVQNSSPSDKLFKQHLQCCTRPHSKEWNKHLMELYTIHAQAYDAGHVAIAGIVASLIEAHHAVAGLDMNMTEFIPSRTLSEHERVAA